MLYVVHLVLLVSMNCPYLERREKKNKNKTFAFAFEKYYYICFVGIE
jgi:hypothetical protein